MQSVGGGGGYRLMDPCYKTPPSLLDGSVNDG